MSAAVTPEASGEPDYLTQARRREASAREAFDGVRDRALDGSVTGAEYAEAKAEIDAADLGVKGAMARWEGEQKQSREERAGAAIGLLTGPEMALARAAAGEAWHELQAPLLRYVDAVAAASKLGGQLGENAINAAWATLPPGEEPTLNNVPALKALEQVPRHSPQRAREVAVESVVSWLKRQATRTGHDVAYRGGFQRNWEADAFERTFGIDLSQDEQ